MYVCAHTNHSGACTSKETTYRNPFCPSVMWVLRLRSSHSGGKHLSLLDHPPPSPILPFHTLDHTESCHGEADLSWGSQRCIGEMGQLNMPHLAWHVLPLPGSNPQNQQYKCTPRRITCVTARKAIVNFYGNEWSCQHVELI